MFDAGLEKEVSDLLKTYPKDAPGLSDAAYRSLISYIEGGISREDAINEVVKAHASLAKRQMTWFKRNPDTQWVGEEKEANTLVTSFLERL